MFPFRQFCVCSLKIYRLHFYISSFDKNCFKSCSSISEHRPAIETKGFSLKAFLFQHESMTRTRILIFVLFLFFSSNKVKKN